MREVRETVWCGGGVGGGQKGTEAMGGDEDRRVVVEMWWGEGGR